MGLLPSLPKIFDPLGIHDKVNSLFEKAAGEAGSKQGKEELRTDGHSNPVTGDIADHSFDRNVQDSLDKFNKTIDGGKQVSGKQMAEAIKNMGDLGQITREEYMDLREFVQKNWDKLSPEAKEAFNKLDNAVQSGGNKPGWMDGGFDGGTRHDVVLKGPELKNLLKELEGIGKKEGSRGPKEDDGVEGSGGHGGGGGHSGGCDDPKKPGGSRGAGGAEGAGGAGGASFEGMSWHEIFAMLMDIIGKKEKEAKAKAREVGEKLSASTDENGNTDEGLKRDMAELQDFMKQLEQMVTTLSNLQDKNASIQMAVINKI